jgi:hypothetical protein
MTAVYARVAAFANITGGAPAQVNAACVAATPAAERYRCFMAQYTYPHVRTPTYMLNSKWDLWQLQNILALDADTSRHSSPYAPFVPCLKDLVVSPTACNATQFAQFIGYGAQFEDALAAARAATPPRPYATRHGGFITSCAIHSTAIGGLSHRIAVGGVPMYDALVAWVKRRTAAAVAAAGEAGEAAGSAGDDDEWIVDGAWPHNPTCPK